jgi:hypothetical protein
LAALRNQTEPALLTTGTKIQKIDNQAEPTTTRVTMHARVVHFMLKTGHARPPSNRGCSAEDTKMGHRVTAANTRVPMPIPR